MDDGSGSTPPLVTAQAMASRPIVTGRVIAKSPPIIMGGLHGRANDFPLGVASLDAFLQEERPMFFFFCAQWSFQDKNYLKTNVNAIMDRKAQFPQHAYSVLVNDPMDLVALRSAAPMIDAFVWNTNCTADPGLFPQSPSNQEEFEFDAVFNARLSPYKRLSLASAIERLCLISRGFDNAGARNLRKTLPRAVIPNIMEDGSVRILPAADLAEYMNRSRCGLMLSEMEGQNRATIEYLLCGLPVVTTPNFGGRDRFLTPSNSLFAAPDLASVAESVKAVAEVGFDRNEIRAEALRAMAAERKRLVQIINHVIGRTGERPLLSDDIKLTHKTSSDPQRLEYFFEHLGRANPMPRQMISAPLCSRS